MKSYPYIGQTESGHSIFLFTQPYKGYVIKHMVLREGHFEDNLFELDINDITFDYLKGKCVRIISAAQGEFIQKLAFNAGYEWPTKGKQVMMTPAPYIAFESNGKLVYDYGGSHDVILGITKSVNNLTHDSTFNASDIANTFDDPDNSADSVRNLTPREQFAMSAMNVMLASLYYGRTDIDMADIDVAAKAAQYADDLITQIGKARDIK